MPKKCIKFIPEYLIPNLNNKRFGERLKWIDKSKNIFEIDWYHKSGPLWTEEEAAVFVEWDKHKGHFQPEDKQYYTKSKQRFRALLYKLTKEGQLKKLESPTKTKKVFSIGQKNSRRKKRQLDVENEFFTEEETSVEEFEDIEDIYSRKVSEDDAVNVLEDHSYTVTGSIENNLTENERATSNSQDTFIQSRESSDNFQKRILMERNHENVITLIPNLIPYTDFFSPFDDLGSETENANMTTLAAGKLPMDPNLSINLNTTFPENTLADIFKNMEFLDSV